MRLLFDLAPSPNCLKARLALRAKGLDFETRAVDPLDRSEVLEASGQEGLPVLQDRGVTIVDSEAILHYLDANYPETPRLYPRTKEGRRACEAWKAELDERVARHWAPVFFYAIKRRDTLDEEARARFQEGLRWLEEELAAREHFQPAPDMLACDLRVAEWAVYALPGEGLIERVRLFARFAEHFGVERGSLPNLERFLEPWNGYLA